MTDRATIRLTASTTSDDAIGQLVRAADLARELEALGFTVTLSGDIYIDAKVAVPRDQAHPSDDEPDAG